ncbi:MAG: single-stranded DNA-binding protein [Pseudonocardia sp.]|nr:single-stranded DNA-binding protein [Pseudonocardia sp.]
MNEIRTTVVGNIVSTGTLRRLQDGTELVSFRIANNPRRLNRLGEWIEVGTTFISVTCWRRLAHNVLTTFVKGDPVMVSGRLQTREYEKDGQVRLVVEMEAEAVGPDLNRCTAAITRVQRDPSRGSAAGTGEERDAARQDTRQQEACPGGEEEPPEEPDERLRLDEMADLVQAGLPAGTS